MIWDKLNDRDTVERINTEMKRKFLSFAINRKDNACVCEHVF